MERMTIEQLKAAIVELDRELDREEARHAAAVQSITEFSSPAGGLSPASVHSPVPDAGQQAAAKASG